MSLTIDINFVDAGWEEQKHPRGKSGEHGGQFVKKGEADVTTHEHARYAGTNPHEHTTEGLHKALTLLKPANLNKIDREHRKTITAEIISRTLSKPPQSKPAVPASQPAPTPAATPAVAVPKPAATAGGKMPEATGDPWVDTETFVKLRQDMDQKRKAWQNAGPEQDAAAESEFKTAREMWENFELEMNDAAAVKNATKQTSKPLSAPTDAGDQFVRSAGLAGSLGHYTLKLPKSTRLALRKYAGNAYHEVNGSLRDGSPLNPKMQGIVNSIDEWMQKPESRAKKSFVTYRGLDLSAEQSRALKKGATLFNPAYSSTSLLKDVAEGFAQGKFLMRVTVSAGTPVAYLGGCCANQGANEMEALLPRGIPMKVTGTRQSQGMTILEVTV